jgi:glutamate-ammonia-ligase adenylyltransferase
MSGPFASRLRRLPLAADPEAGAEAARAFAAGGDLAPLIAGAAGSSPFLGGLLRREAAWARVALTLAPETALQAVLTPLAEVPPDRLGTALREAKRRIALLAALADLGGVWSLAEVTGALTQLADRAVELAVRALVAEEQRRGRLPPVAAPAGGMVVLAMGKMGAGELNYSSDIDLVCLFDDACYPGAEAEARAGFIRVTRRLAALLSDMTDEGYVFRTDLRLRPDAAVTPVCLSLSAAEHYYEAEGRTWERAAYIKARPCAGDIAAGERFLRRLTPFVWRRHLDFAAIQDAHDMRLRIREHRQLHGIGVEGHNLKLGAGGIREIEFFTQTRQLIAGGRDPALRERGTLAALAALARRGWVPAEVTAELADHYVAHRTLEHRLQMVNDARTHSLPATPAGVERIARLSGEADTLAFRAALLDRLARVDRLTEGFFAPAAAVEGPPLSEAARAIVDRWQAYPALRSERAGAVFRRLRPQLLARLARAANPDEALIAFDGFLRGLPAGVQLFSLFEANPSLVDLIVDICATAPGLAAYLARNAGVFDAVIGGSFFAPWPGLTQLAVELGAAMAAPADYERKLDAARVFMKEWHFRVGVHHLRGLIDGFEAGKLYADLAGAVLAGLWPVVTAEFARKHGPPPGRGAMLLGMGSLGAGRLNAGSDLDLIVIYDAAGSDESAGPRPLPARSYFARLTQALVTALTAPMAGGRLYAVDMRLRPSGRQGPVAVSLPAFTDYQMREAWTWEHLALTRARPVAGAAGLCAEIEAARRQILAAKAGGARILADVADMRARLAAAKPAEGAWEAKHGPGRLMDIELFAQSCALRTGSPARAVETQLRAGAAAGLLPAAAEAAMLDAYRLCWRLHAGTRALTEGTLDPARIGEGGRAFILREAGQPDAAALRRALDAATAAAAAAVGAALDAAGGDDGPGRG